MAKARKNFIESLAKMSPEDLGKNLARLREEMKMIRWKAEGARSKNVKEFSNLRKQVARILTKMNSEE